MTNLKFTISDCYESCQTKQASHHRSYSIEYKKQAARDIYNKYHEWYTDNKVNHLKAMIECAILQGEHSCGLYDEYTSSEDPLSPEELESLFENGLETSPSLRSLISERLSDKLCIWLMRSSESREMSSPLVRIQYVLVWRSPPPHAFNKSVIS
jgi:hypothetical protein